jgi:hypothetical protein
MSEQPLPRQTYKTHEHARIEQEIAELWARAWQLEQIRIGVDDPDKQKPRVDRVVIKDEHVVAFAENKSSSVPFGKGDGWITGIRKITNLRKLYDVVRVPVLMVVRFGCGTIAHIDIMKPFQLVRGWGRHDRGDPGDVEDGCRFAWDDFKVARS